MKKRIFALIMAMCLALSLLFLISQSYNPFIYFQF